MRASGQEWRAELYGLASRGIDLGLSRVRGALDKRGWPGFGVVHVAGTNGKGSVVRMVAEGLRGGARVGAFTSPHLHRLGERAWVDGQDASDEELEAAYARLGADHGLSFFEAVTVMTLDLFERRGVEIAVLETGLGGRLDATNVFPRPVCAAITRIDLDHQHLLGADLATIAAEKAGVLKPGCPAVTGVQAPEAARVLEDRARLVGAPLDVVGPLEEAATATLALGGRHQRENAAIARRVLERCAEAGYAVDVARGLSEVVHPGRLEAIVSEGCAFLLDAAHNPSGAAALGRALDDEEERAGVREPRVLVFGCMRDKDWPSMLDALAPRVDAVVYVRPPVSRGLEPAALSAARPGELAGDIDEALALARRAADRLGSRADAAPAARVIVAGSIFVIAPIRARLRGLPEDPPITF